MATALAIHQPPTPSDATARVCLEALAVYLGCAPEDVSFACRALDLASDAVLVVDCLQRIVYCNQRASELTGARREELLGQRCADGMRFVTCGQGCSLFRDGTICGRRCELVSRSGAPRSVVKNARVLEDASGRPVGGIETIHDITDLREARPGATPELELEYRLVSVLARATHGVALAVDSEGCVTHASDEAAALLGCDGGAMLGRTLGELLVEAAAIEALLGEALRTGRARDAMELHARGAREQPLTLRIAPVAPAGGPIAGATLVIRADPGRAPSYHGIVGSTPIMRRLYRAIDALARSDANVLLSGPSGVGKELVARALHLAGPRREGPFLAVNCAALSETLLESELFGHERGAFTGAVGPKPGRLELCEDGTFLFDEVGCLPLALQAKLLRVLEQREFERVGGTRSIRLRARVVAATNADLAALVQTGAFREDLYYRLRVVPLEVPALRERPGDIVELARHFVRALTAGDEGGTPSLTPAAVGALETYPWPGNVRELRNALQYAVAMGGGGVIDVADLPRELRSLGRAAGGERERIVAALTHARYNRERAAELLGISRTTLWRRMRACGIG